MIPDWLSYQNQNAVRSLPLSDQLVQAMGFLPEMGLQMEVFSGGQPVKGSGLPRVGSVRHDNGNAADVFFTRDGQRLDWANPQHVPVFQDVVRNAKAAGVTGFGAGPGYMQQGSMHIGYGTPAVWGAEGKGVNAPDWLREAYGSAPKPSLTYGSAVPKAPIDLASIYTGAPALSELHTVQPQNPASALSEMFTQKRKDCETAAKRRREALFGDPL